MRAQIDSEKTDFHFVRQDSDGSWSHKQGAGPAKKTDDDDHDIKDPEKAKIDDYKICGYFCFCSGMQVAMLVPAGPRQPYATVVLKEPGLLTSKSMDLELSAGRLTLLYEDKVAQPHATVSAEIFSGEANPVWNLRADDINAIASMLRDLPRSERRPVYRINYQGFNFENSYEQLPSHMQVLEGLISFREGDKISWFEDIHGLEKWLMRYALKQAFRACRASATF